MTEAATFIPTTAKIEKGDRVKITTAPRDEARSKAFGNHPARPGVVVTGVVVHSGPAPDGRHRIMVDLDNGAHLPDWIGRHRDVYIPSHFDDKIEVLK